MIDQSMDNNCMTPAMILITLANFLCFMESFRSKIAHQIEPTIKITLTNWRIKGIAVEVVVICIVFK